MKHSRFLLASSLGLALCAPTIRLAHADDPAPTADDDPTKREARALLREGVRLLGTGDNAGALALFQSGYKLFPSSKILLNIGSTLKTMGRAAEAANTYQRFLDAADSDAAKKHEVEVQLLALDVQLGKLAIVVDLADAEVQIDGAWQPVATTKLVRVTAGAYELHARKLGGPDVVVRGELAAGATGTATFTLTPAAPVSVPVPVVVAKPAPVVVAAVTSGAPFVENSYDVGAVNIAHVPRVGALLHVIVDGKGRGAAALAGALFDVTDRVELEAGFIVGPTFGGYVGGIGYLMTGSLRPLIGVGVPMFSSMGVRVGVRGSAGVEWRATPHLAVVAELGIEHYFNAEGDIDATAFEPIVGVNGRL